MITSLRKIIDKNNVKISYFCTNNISKIIDNHNKKLINKLDCNNNDNLKHSCNNRNKNECPLGNKCNLNDIIYQADVASKENDTNDKAYIGITSLNWKFRYYNHLQSFKNPTSKIWNCPIKVLLGSKRTKTNTYYKLENKKKIFLNKHMVSVNYA